MLRNIPASLARVTLRQKSTQFFRCARFLQVLANQNNALSHDYSMAPVTDSSKTLVASVAILGAPNAGKSSLVNSMIRNRIAAVSRKVNTTRSRTVGAYTEGLRQLIFWDTPGIVERQFVKQLGSDRREISTGGWGAAADADVSVMVVDASRGLQYWKKCAKISEQLAKIRRTILEARQEKRSEDVNGGPVESELLIVLNKCDITRPRTRLLEAAEFFRDNVEGFANNFDQKVYMVSAYNGRGVEDLRQVLLGKAKPGSFEVPAGTSHCEDDLDLIREHIWEKLLHCVHREVPYTCKFENDGLIELPNGDVHVSEIIRVPRRGVVPIVIGPQGRNIQWIRDTAMVSSSAALGRQVYLKLCVKAA